MKQATACKQLVKVLRIHGSIDCFAMWAKDGNYYLGKIVRVHPENPDMFWIEFYDGDSCYAHKDHIFAHLPTVTDKLWVEGVNVDKKKEKKRPHPCKKAHAKVHSKDEVAAAQGLLLSAAPAMEDTLSNTTDSMACLFQEAQRQLGGAEKKPYWYRESVDTPLKTGGEFWNERNEREKLRFSPATTGKRTRVRRFNTD